MKRYLPLIITNAALIGVYTLIFFIMSMISAIQMIGFATIYVVYLVAYIFLAFFFVVMTIVAAFVFKTKKYMIPVGGFAIFLWGVSLAEFILGLSYADSSSTTSVVMAVICFVIATTVLILSVIEICLVKPFRRDDYNPYGYPQYQPPYGQPYPQPYPQYQNPYGYPQQPYPPYGQPYPQQQVPPQYQPPYGQPYPQPHYQQPYQKPAQQPNTPNAGYPGNNNQSK